MARWSALVLVGVAVGACDSAREPSRPGGGNVRPADAGFFADAQAVPDSGLLADAEPAPDAPEDGGVPPDGGGVLPDSGVLARDASTARDALGATDATADSDGGVLAPDAAVGADAGFAADSGLPSSGVTFVVHVPAGTPAYEGVFVSGSDPALGSWDGRGIALARVEEGLWTGTVALPAGALEYKATRGAWATVEKAADGSEIPNRTATVAGLTRVEITVARWVDRPTVTGDVESLGVFRSALLAARPVLVYLPPSYRREPNRRFPVLYLHDGQNVFDARTAFGNSEWAADEAAERLIDAQEIAPLIMVAVGNTGDRIAEYTPTPSPGYGGGDGDIYARLLVEELKPMIDARYRTLPDPANTGVLGSSLGGLISMHIGLTRSDVFQRVGVVSPSVWWNGRVIVQRVDALAAHLPLRIWLDIGTMEGSDTGEVPLMDARALRDALLRKGWRAGADLSYFEAQGADHSEAAWRARFPDMLRWLYPP